MLSGGLIQSSRQHITPTQPTNEPVCVTNDPIYVSERRRRVLALAAPGFRESFANSELWR
jgi:hypothetical protein